MSKGIDPAEMARSAGDFLASCGLGATPELEPLRGGANNRVFRVSHPGRSAVLKVYFRDAADTRDRFGHERSFYEFAWGRGVRQIPQPLGWEAERRLGLFEWIPGGRLEVGSIGESVIGEAADFVIELNRERGAPALPLASEACFSVGEHLATIGGRVERLKGIQLEDAIDRDAASFAEEKLAPSWRAVEKEIHGKAANVAGNTGLLDESQRCVSPSDFGFHNALIGTDSRLRFLDFEYAGRDDPAKLVCDFFCQPELPVPIRFWDYFSDRLEAGVGWASGWRERARLLLPAYRVKWCCILLNEFLRSGRDRRAFASSSEQNADRRPTQLDKARKLWGTMGALI